MTTTRKPGRKRTPRVKPEDGVTFREITLDEYRDMLDSRTREKLGLSLAEFAQRYNAGEYDDPDDDPVIGGLGWELEFLQQNGHVVQ